MSWLRHQIPVYLALLPLAVSLIVFTAAITGIGFWLTSEKSDESDGDLIYVTHLTDNCAGYAPSPRPRILAIPVGFIVDPLDAAKKLPGCWKKLNTAVYADRKNYYVGDAFMGFRPSIDRMYVVSGTTGELIRSPAQIAPITPSDPLQNPVFAK